MRSGLMRGYRVYEPLTQQATGWLSLRYMETSNQPMHLLKKLVESETVLRNYLQKNFSYVKAKVLGDTLLKEQKTVQACQVMHDT